MQEILAVREQPVFTSSKPYQQNLFAIIADDIGSWLKSIEESPAINCEHYCNLLIEFIFTEHDAAMAALPNLVQKMKEFLGKSAPLAIKHQVPFESFFTELFKYICFPSDLREPLQRVDTGKYGDRTEYEKMQEAEKVQFFFYKYNYFRNFFLTHVLMRSGKFPDLNKKQESVGGFLWDLSETRGSKMNEWVGELFNFRVTTNFIKSRVIRELYRPKVLDNHPDLKALLDELNKHLSDKDKVKKLWDLLHIGYTTWESLKTQ